MLNTNRLGCSKSRDICFRLDIDFYKTSGKFKMKYGTTYTVTGQHKASI